MPRATVSAENSEALVENIELVPPPSDFGILPDPSEMMDAKIGGLVADGIAKALPAVMASLMETLRASVPNVGAAPSQVVKMGGPATSVQPKNYLKHYRMDDTPSGKYQMLNMDVIRNGADLETLEGIQAAVMKGKFIHFVSDHFYATKQNEVDFIEYMLANAPGFRAYEDEGAGVIPCPVVNCNKFFSTDQGLHAHMKATHGVDRI